MTQVSHTARALRTALRAVGTRTTEPAPGLLDVTTSDPAAVLALARGCLSSVEAAEVRALVVEDEDGDALLTAALAAPTLARLAARAEHADLLPLFADETRAFRSVYQPIVRLGVAPDAPEAERVVGYEALLRARDARGEVLPAALFAAAEAAGWLHVLDRVGRTTALRGASGWLGEAQLFVNFLPTTIYRPQVCLRTTERAAERAGLRLDQLVFEVTESEQVADLDHLADVFAYYRERGCRVALDDLGAGYSSLNLLVRLQPDVVKLDKDIVQRLPEPASAAVVAAVVDITHAYGGLVLAECVETADQAAAARDLGVDLGQGWHFGRPQERTADAAAGGPARRAGDAPAGPPPGAPAAWQRGPGRGGNDPAVALPPRPAGTGGGRLVPGARGSADVEALLWRAVDVSSSGVTIADATEPDMPLIYVNEAFEQVTGWSSADVLGRNCRFLQGEGTDPEVVRGLRAALDAGTDHLAVLRNVRRDGSPWWNELRLSPVRDTSGRVTHYFGFQHDVTARVEAERRVAHLAYHDPLTGLANRARLLQQLEQALAAAAEQGRHVVALFVDLDGFKAVNDRLGHAAGDRVLAVVAQRLRTALRERDLVGRYSGDEFVAVLPDVEPGRAAATGARAAGAVLAALERPCDAGGVPVQLGASIGVAVYPDTATDAEALVQAADRAMYAAKAAGRGRALLA